MLESQMLEMLQTILKHNEVEGNDFICACRYLGGGGKWE